LSHDLLRDPAFFQSLLIIDREVAEEARAGGCLDCGGKLHRADFWRRPAGGLENEAVRFSFCCAAEGCRKRRTPGSVRFLGRRVYLAVIVVLASVLRQGMSAHRAEQLGNVLGVSERTLGRWRRWWLQDFAQSRFLRGRRGQLDRPVDPDRLPTSLLERFGDDARSRLVLMLRFLVPITGGQGLAAQAF
jgi:hypothetical protein